MEKISGLVLDAYDDPSGRVLKSMYPQLDQLPERIKTAMPVTRDQLERLPDDVFALVLRQGDASIRKYACVDEGHTLLNIGYFLASFDKLPVEAVKTAAANLVTACGWYDIEPPEELKKLSTGAIPVIGKQQVWKDVDGTTYGNDAQSWDLQKTADVTGSPDMPSQVSKSDLAARKKPLSYAKTAEEMDHLVDTDAEGDEDTILAQAFGVSGENPEKLPQVKKVIEPHVDVTDKEPPRLIQSKEAEFYALPHLRKYPLDSYTQVKRASAYFDENYKMMPPDDRHTYAVNLLRRAQPMDIGVSKTAEAYGQLSYAPDEHVALCVGHRIHLLEQHADDTDVRRKLASIHDSNLYRELLETRHLMTPPMFARTLAEIDKIAGLDELWDQDVVDPFLSTFGKTASDDKDTLVVGNEYMKVCDLERFATSKADLVRKKFSEDFIEEFQKDPVAIFESMPMDQKVVIMRMVNAATETRMS